MPSEAGYTNTTGARHAEAFSESVKHSGWLNELMLPIKTYGITNIKELLKLARVGLRAQQVPACGLRQHKPRDGDVREGRQLYAAR